MTRLDLDAQRVTNLLLMSLVLVEVSLVLGDLLMNVKNVFGIGPIRGFFNIALEDSAGSWFSVTQVWMCGLTAAWIYLVLGTNDGERWRRAGWAIIALFLIYMAIDDGAKLHERVGSAVRRYVQGSEAESGSRQIGFFPSYTWQLVFLPIFAAFGAFLLGFLQKELSANRDRIFVVAAMILLVLAVLADFLEGIDSDHPLNLINNISQLYGWDVNLVRHLSRVAEEFLEMLAITLLWVVFIRHAIRLSPDTRICFRNLP